MAIALLGYALDGEVKADESYVGGIQNTSRGVGGKVAVFGLRKRGGNVYAVIIPKSKTET